MRSAFSRVLPEIKPLLYLSGGLDGKGALLTTGFRDLASREARSYRPPSTSARVVELRTVSRRTDMGARRRVAVAVAVSLLAVSCWRADTTEEGGERTTSTALRRETGLDVLLITVDTLRADALGSYGKVRAGTPWMDRLAAAGVRFDDAHAHNVLTLPSHANILSGLYPQEHGVRDNSGFRFPSSALTLATVLEEQGYRTGAFISAFPLDSRFGLSRGFEVYDDSFVDATSRPAFFEQERRGIETVDLARRWLIERDPSDTRPSFCWVHLYEPHFPYAPPAPFAEAFSDDPYQGEVAATDAALELLLEPVLSAGDAGKTLVVLTSDHGEALGEHGEATHGIFAYEASLKVPLILFQPRLFEPRVVEEPARHIDVLPTILDALSIPAPGGLRGRSVLPIAAGVLPQGPASEPAGSYFEVVSIQLTRGWAPLFGLVRNDLKYIDLPIPELYDLTVDPGERHNLMATDRQRARPLLEELTSLRALDLGAAPERESREVRERLEALGYVSGGASPSEVSYTEDDDPKRLVALDAIQREITGLHAAGDLQTALERARELVRRRPGMRLALFDLAQLERESGHLDRAVEALRQALVLAPRDPATLAFLSTCLTQAGRPGEAIELTGEHARSPEPDVDVLFARGLAYAKLRQPREALATFRRAAEVDPENPRTPVHVGTLYLMAGRRAEAAEAYRQALALNPKTAAAHVSLAIMATEDGRGSEALAHWRSAVATDPREGAKLFAIGSRLWDAGRLDEARPLLELFTRSAQVATFQREIARARSLLSLPRQ